MTQPTGDLWALIERWRDSLGYIKPSQRKLAKELGVSSSALSDYKYARHMPGPEFLERLAVEIGVPYEVVLDAALIDAGYRPERKGVKEA